MPLSLKCREGKGAKSTSTPRGRRQQGGILLPPMPDVRTDLGPTGAQVLPSQTHSASSNENSISTLEPNILITCLLDAR